MLKSDKGKITIRNLYPDDLQNHSLAHQTEQLARVEEGIQEVNTYLKLASKELRAFVRRTATDKIIMSFVCLIVIGIIFIIIWQSLKGIVLPKCIQLRLCN